MKLVSTLAALALLAAMLAACGDDEDEAVPAGTTTTAADSGRTGATGSGPPVRCPGAESPTITQVISYGADCAAVEDALAGVESVSREFRAGDFACERTSGTSRSGVWECRGEATAFTFTFGD